MRCFFLKWSGFRPVEDALRDLVRRNPGSLRILTTAYMSATDRRALDELKELGAEVRASYLSPSVLLPAFLHSSEPLSPRRGR